VAQLDHQILVVEVAVVHILVKVFHINLLVMLVDLE